jgi:ACS family hexuronate transporter-like MFS transporter
MNWLGYRWRICALLFFATTINYLDRQVLGLLKPALAGRLGWSETEYSYIVITFTACYALGLLLSGKIVDRLGVKIGYAACVFIWSVAACGHALVRSTLGFGAMRALLGVSEAASFPAAVKSVSEWFPKGERAFAVGILTAGTSIGAVVAPAVVPWLAATYGWQAAFVATGLTGFIWLGFWYVMYEIPQRHRKVQAQELALILEAEADTEESGRKISWFSLFKYRATWMFFVGKLLTDPVWWFMAFWLPSYFHSRFDLNLQNLGLPLVIIYVATSLGSVAGGWSSSRLIARGWPVSKARQTTMFAIACLVVPIVFAPWVDSMWAMVGLLSLAVGSHQGWSANLFTRPADMFPKAFVGSVVGIGGMAGALGSTLFPFFVGRVLDHFKALGNINTGYNIIFAICGCAYLAAWLLMRAIQPTEAKIEGRNAMTVPSAK